MFISTLPPDVPVSEVRMYCSVEASTNLSVPADLLYALAMAEGGTPGSKMRNSNGTYDLGYMQFNTAYLKSLEKFGIRPEDVQSNTCYPFHLAAWRLHQHLDEQGDDIYQKAAYYHSRTPKYNEIYANKLRHYASVFDYKKATLYLKMQNDLVQKELDKLNPKIEFNDDSSAVTLNMTDEQKAIAILTENDTRPLFIPQYAEYTAHVNVKDLNLQDLIYDSEFLGEIPLKKLSMRLVQ